MDDRPFQLTGTTYQLKTPAYDASFFVTINDLDGKPFEIFINSKNTEAAMWIGILTLTWSSILRRGEDIEALINDMLSVSDPRGGHFSNEEYHHSIIYEIGRILEDRVRVKKIPDAPGVGVPDAPFTKLELGE